jgi:hypothetical protein
MERLNAVCHTISLLEEPVEWTDLADDEEKEELVGLLQMICSRQ